MVAHRGKDSGVKSGAFKSSVIHDNITCTAMLVESILVCVLTLWQSIGRVSGLGQLVC